MIQENSSTKSGRLYIHIGLDPLFFYTPMSKFENMEPPDYTPWGCNPINAGTKFWSDISCMLPILWLSDDVVFCSLPH